MSSTSWEDAKAKQQYPALKKDRETDVVVVGGGMAGVLTAYRLARSGCDVVLLEKNTLGHDTTLFTTAFLTKDIDTDLHDLKSMFGSRKARLVWESHQAAIDEIEATAKRESIDCDFKRVPLYIYAPTPDDFAAIESDFRTAQELGLEAVLQENGTVLPFPNVGYLRLSNQAKFHPLKFLESLAISAGAAGAAIYEKTAVQDIRYYKTGATVRTPRGTVRAREVVLATYYPFKNPWRTFLKKGMYVSYVFEVSVPTGVFPEALYIDTQNPYHYVRIDAGTGKAKTDRMIIGGEDHREELPMQPAKNFQALEKYLKQIMNGRSYTITKRWTGPILEPVDGLALIGRSKDHELVATAFSGNGMTYSMIAADVLHDIVLKKKNSWEKLYDPKRMPSAKQLAKKTFDYGEELIEGAAKNAFQKKRRQNPAT